MVVRLLTAVGELHVGDEELVQNQKAVVVAIDRGERALHVASTYATTTTTNDTWFELVAETHKLLVVELAVAAAVGVEVLAQRVHLARRYRDGHRAAALCL